MFFPGSITCVLHRTVLPFVSLVAAACEAGDEWKLVLISGDEWKLVLT